MLQEIFDKQDDKHSSIFFFVTNLVEQNMSFLIKSYAKSCRTVKGIIFSKLNNTWVICCHMHTNKAKKLDEKDLFPLTFELAIFSSRISPATVCSIVQIVVLLLKHFYSTCL